MKLDIFQIDAFTDRVFGGNPACVVPLKAWLDDEILLNIARENAVAETAFFVEFEDRIGLRWFTPEIEMDLCGHATLATTHALHSILERDATSFVFDTQSGRLEVGVEKGLYHMDFPSRKPIETSLPKAISNSLSIQPQEVFKARDYVLVYNSEEEIKNIKVDRNRLDQINLDPGGVIVTSQGSDCDFVSRFFTPQASILEDPVTGSAHCSLIPFWAERLDISRLIARQLSERGGVLHCQDKGERVIISGSAKTYLIGSLWVE